MALATTAIILLFIYLTLVQEVTLRIVRTKETIIYIDFLFIQAILYPSRKKSKNKKKLSVFDFLAALNKSIPLLLKNSELTVNDLNFPVLQGNPASDATRSEAIAAIVFAILTYFKEKTRTIKLKDRVFTAYSLENNKSIIDVSLKFELFRFFYPVLIFVFELRKRKREKRFAGKQNE